MLPFSGGTRMSLDTLLARIEKAHREQQIEGITLLGGEPFAHAAFATELAIQVQRRGLSVMAFTGYTLDQLQTSMLEAASELLKRVDVLVDGPYRAHEPESRRRWIGSTNQRVHFLSDRYGDTGEWRKANTVEIRMQDGEIFVSGFPTSGMQKAFGGLPQCGPAGGSTGGAASGDEAAAGAGP
jgi:anaerobic ribonucleoside-triphosphate reductase activating protein